MKLTKREYTKQMNDLTTRRANAIAEVESAIRNVEHLDRPLTEDEWTNINFLHDTMYDIEEQMRDLGWRWDTRNWTGSDWNTHALIAQNID